MVCTVVLSVVQDRHGYEVWISRCRHVAASCLITIFVIFCHETDFQSPSLKSAHDRPGSPRKCDEKNLSPPIDHHDSDYFRNSIILWEGSIDRSDTNTYLYYTFKIYYLFIKKCIIYPMILNIK